MLATRDDDYWLLELDFGEGSRPGTPREIGWRCRESRRNPNVVFEVEGSFWYCKASWVGQGKLCGNCLFVIAFAQAASPSRPRRHVATSLFRLAMPLAGLNVPSAGLDAGCPRPASFVQLHGLPAFRP